MILKGWLWLIQLPSANGKSGKREVAVTVAIFAAFVLFWGWDDLTAGSKAEVVSWCLTVAAALLIVAFGMDAAFRQMGFRWSNDDRPPPEPDLPEPRPDPGDAPRAPSVEDMQRRQNREPELD